MTPLQRGILFETLRGGMRRNPSSSLSVVFQGSWKPALWRQVWDGLVQRHEILRTEVVWKDVPMPEWRVHSAGQAIWQECDWSALDDAERTTQWQALTRGTAGDSFSIDYVSSVPFMRLTWVIWSPFEFRLVFRFAPFLLDEASCCTLLREACHLYAAMADGFTMPEPRDCSYDSYAQWQTEGDSAEAREYWDAYAKQFDGGTLLSLPMEGCSEVGRKQACLEIPNTEGEDNPCSWVVLAHAAWTVLLHRYTRDNQVVFGSWHDHRSNLAHKSFGACLGIRGNMVPFCQMVDASIPAMQFLRRVENDYRSACLYDRAAWLDTVRGRQLAAQQFTFETILKIEDEEDAAWVDKTYGGMRPVQSETRLALPFALIVTVTCGTRITVKADYDASRFDAQVVDCLLSHFQALMIQLATRPQATLGQLDMVNGDECQTLMKIWNPMPVQNFEVACLHELFTQQAMRVPQSTALTCGREQWTYEELDRRSNQLAHYLRKLGVGPEVMVGLCLRRTAWLPTAILAILKAGGAYVPMDPAYPAERRAFILDDCHATVLVVEREYVDDMFLTQARLVVLDEIADQLSDECIAPPVSVSLPEHLAYVIYTSGSTGRPKGVMVEHRHVARLMQATRAWYHFDDKDVWTLFHSCAFDFSVWEIWGALLYGGRLVIVPFDVARTPEAFWDLLCRERVTVLNQTPSAFKQLVQAETRSKNNLALRYIIFGGEALALRDLHSWFECHGDEKPLVVNMYGITETTVHVTFRPIRKSDMCLKAQSVIGTPLPDLRVYLLDEGLHPVPIGVPGEICVGGAGVARGYLNRSELNAEKYAADSFSTLPGARLYRSGDLARCWSNGEMEYFGRMDQQVKIRGFRVELGEIESVLARHPGVHSPLVVLHGQDGNQRLVAYIVRRQASPPSIADLRQFMSRELPDYMVPSAFVFLDSIPLTANGKVDKRALSIPSDDRPDLGNGMVPPRTSMESTLAALWQSVLGIKNPGVFDNFFDLGGHSFSLAQVYARLRTDLGCEFPITILFQYPTIATLAAYLEGGGDGAPHWAGRVRERTLRQQQSAVRFKRVNILKS